jgi:ribosomal protein S18 acetylase RimI-like enzyme
MIWADFQDEASMTLTIRKATPADVPDIVEFNCRMAAETESKTLDPEIVTAGVAATVADPHKLVYFVAEENHILLGQLGITLEWSDWRNGWWWWLQSVFVRPEARRRGVFRSLYEYVSRLAQADPTVLGLRLLVEKDNHAAQETYLSLGMEPIPYLALQKHPP